MVRRRPTPTMADVAQATGLSPTTVSFVINDVPYANIPEETRQRVWRAVRELGYRPNAAAKMLRTQRSQTIGFISDEVATTPNAGEVIRGAQERAWSEDKLLMIVNTGGDASLLEAAVETLLARQVEGIIYAAMFHQEISSPTNLGEVPVVLLDCFSADRALPSIVPDEVSGGRTATNVLLEHGHRRIGMINLNYRRNPAAAYGRLQGYGEALAAAGVAFDPALVIESRGNADDGYLSALRLLQLDVPPTALFCATDRMAMGAYDAIRDCGLRVPDDVSVVGFDNQELIAAYLRPALTTVALPHYAMGRWAVEHLLELIEAAPGSAPIQRLEPCPLVTRASVRRLAS